jgi:hypothetical protein
MSGDGVSSESAQHISWEARDPREIVQIMIAVQSGNMHPAAAESWAAEQGRAPFVPEPNSAALSKLQETHWAIGLVVGWAAHRIDVESVRAERSIKVWRNGALLPNSELARAKEDVLQALRRGEIASLGRSRPGLPRKPIAPLEWRDLRWDMSGSIDWFRSQSDASKYFDVVFDASEVRRLWPAMRPGQAAALSTIADETACYQGIVALIQASPHLPESKADLRARLFSSLPKRAFERAFRRAVLDSQPNDWSAPGRRPKRHAQ